MTTSPPERQPLSDLQDQAYRVIELFFLDRGRMPSRRELADRLGRTAAAAQQFIRVLERKGWLTREKHGEVRLGDETPIFHDGRFHFPHPLTEFQAKKLGQGIYYRSPRGEGPDGD